MRYLISMIAAVTLVAAGLVGCAGSTDLMSNAQPTEPDPVITPTGLAGVEFGASRTDLTREQGLRQAASDCAPRLPTYPSASPVFADDQLVLLWADPPLRTPAGLAVDTPVAQVRTAHPDAEELRAPAGTYRFDGLLVTLPDQRAYLFLHDQQQVRKLIVGYERHARLLFEEGFGTC